MPKFIKTVEQLINSVDRFMTHPEYWREAVGSHPKYFVHYQNNKSHFFGLSKYCAFDSIDLPDYVSRLTLRNTTQGGTTQKLISKVTNKSWTPFYKADEHIRKAFKEWFFDFFPKTYDLDKNISFISLKPNEEISPKKISKAISPEQLRENLKRQNEIGRVGELIALRYESERLAKLNVKEPLNWIDHVSKRNAAAGFDIWSHPHGQEVRYIEVKASTNTNDSFYITQNEVITLQKHKSQSYLYIVHVTDLKNNLGDVIQEIQDPIDKLKSEGILEPILYKAQTKIIKNG